MIHIAIVYHSLYGHTARQAKAVEDGVAQVMDVVPQLLTVKEAQMRWDDLSAADAIVFGAPTYMAGPSAEFKAFQEATSNAVMAKGFLWRNKIAAGFTNSGAQSGDKLVTLMQIALFAAQHGMHWVNPALPPANDSSRGSANGSALGLSAGVQWPCSTWRASALRACAPPLPSRPPCG